MCFSFFVPKEIVMDELCLVAIWLSSLFDAVLLCLPQRIKGKREKSLIFSIYRRSRVKIKYSHSKVGTARNPKCLWILAEALRLIFHGMFWWAERSILTEFGFLRVFTKAAAGKYCITARPCQTFQGSIFINVLSPFWVFYIFLLSLQLKSKAAEKVLRPVGNYVNTQQKPFCVQHFNAQRRSVHIA